SMLRLYVDLIPDMPDRLLYLDNDVICREPFDDFYYQDLTGVQIVGVLDHYGKWFFHHQMRMADYINSGILLLNLPEIK
ncbi:glycosyltransferase, partial [Agathobacter rectalis]|uniref:glycosyltransferase n=1 Tax=Agathobacter rectalis TaxID=39491 RepID=UPI0027D2BE5E